MYGKNVRQHVLYGLIWTLGKRSKEILNCISFLMMKSLLKEGDFFSFC